MQYDTNNVFYKIIREEKRANIVLEGDHFLAFHDITPKASIHILIIPKGNYVDYNDFIENADSTEIMDFNRGISKVVKMMKLEKNGFRIISNAGKFGNQEVMHMHVHILGKASED